MKKNILIIGSGGREHALGWKIKQSPLVGKIYFAPGNPGTADIGENVAIGIKEIDKLVTFAQKNAIDLTVVGPDDSLALGIVDAFQEKKLAIFGPTKASAQIEWSKAWASEFMEKNGIPQPGNKTFSDPEEAKQFIKNNKWNKVVVKASGLALGKGVIVAETKKEAIKAVDEIMVNKEFGDAGNEVVLQEFLNGKEISFFACVDGDRFISLPVAQDHKRIFDNNEGPNTGGMGTYAPVPFVDQKLIKKIEETIIKSFIDGMKKEGHPYKGIIFAGLMLTEKGPKVLEFNARFGDPETQSLMRLIDEDIIPILEQCANGNLKQTTLKIKKMSAVTIVLAAENYPQTPKKGDIIYGLHSINDNDVIVFHAGTKQQQDNSITNGGRVLNVTATGTTLKNALQKAYNIIGENGIHFRGMQFRKDIGYQSL